MLQGARKTEFKDPGMDALGESMLELPKRNINFKVTGISSYGPNKVGARQKAGRKGL